MVSQGLVPKIDRHKVILARLLSVPCYGLFQRGFLHKHLALLQDGYFLLDAAVLPSTSLDSQSFVRGRRVPFGSLLLKVALVMLKALISLHIPLCFVLLVPL